MTIKKRIGARIKSARAEAGLTMQELADKSGTIKKSRLSNWEQGLRTPGPEEINKLSELLGVSAAFLMCLTDKKDSTKLDDQFITMLPILNEENIIKHGWKDASAKLPRLPIENELSARLSDHAFAFKITDNSMSPEFNVNDCIAVDPNIAPKPGQYALIIINDKILIRKVRHKEKSGIELIPANEDWPVVTVEDESKIKLLAFVAEHRRNFFI